jgi:hypothetical protein
MPRRNRSRSGMAVMASTTFRSSRRKSPVSIGMSVSDSQWISR